MNLTSASKLRPNRRSGPRFGRRLLWLLLALALLALMLALASSVAHLVLHTPRASLFALEARIWRLKYVGVALQLLAVAACRWQWTRLVDWVIARGALSPALRAQALAARGKAVLYLLALIALVSIGPGDWLRLYRTFMG